jgi:dephospho-CoA kinase
MIIGVTGKRLSGKTSVAEILRKRYGFRVLCFTEDLLKPILIKRKEPVSRRSLIDLGMEIRRSEGRRDALIMLLSRKVSAGRNYAIAGIRFPEEASFLRKKFGKGFILVAVEASASTRFRRASECKRFAEAATRKDFLRIEQLPTEKIIPKTMKLADFWVNSDGSKGELRREVDRMMVKMRIEKSA